MKDLLCLSLILPITQGKGNCSHSLCTDDEFEALKDEGTKTYMRSTVLHKWAMHTVSLLTKLIQTHDPNWSSSLPWKAGVCTAASKS